MTDHLRKLRAQGLLSNLERLDEFGESGFERVEFVTGGDEIVCTYCLNIAKYSYTIAQARAIIKADKCSNEGPCRCCVVIDEGTLPHSSA